MKTYLFDFDGTLVDSMPTYVGVMLRILDENGIPYDDELMKRIKPLGYVGTAKYYRELGAQLSEEEMIARMRKYAIDEYSNTVPAKANVVDVIKLLKALRNTPEGGIVKGENRTAVFPI